MMLRVDMTGRARGAVRALRMRPSREAGVEVIAEPGPHLPFRDHSVDELFAGSTVAWRSDIAETLDEMWRACKPGALVHLTLPHASSIIALSRDGRPRPLLTLNTFNYYDPRTRPADGPRASFTIERARLRVAGERGPDAGLALARGPFARFIEKVANGSRGSQYRFERWLSGLVAFEEFDVVLSVVKPADVARTSAHSAGASVTANGSGADGHG